MSSSTRRTGSSGSIAADIRAPDPSSCRKYSGVGVKAQLWRQGQSPYCAARRTGVTQQVVRRHPGFQGSENKKTATPGRRRGAAVHFTMTQGGGEGHRSGCAVPATPGRRRGAAGLAIIDPGRRRGPMHSLRSVLPGSGDKVRRHQGGGEMSPLRHRRLREEERAF